MSVVTSVSLLSLAGTISDDDMAYHRQHPLTATNVKRFLAVEYEAITRVLTAKQKELCPNSHFCQALGRLLERAKTSRDARSGLVIDPGTAGERVDMSAKEREAELKRLKSFKKEIAAFFSKQELGDFSRLLDDQKVTLLRTADWPVVVSEAQLPSGEMARHIQTPAARLLGYGGIRGVPSLDSTSEHLPNLWADSYTVGGRELFRGYRHATLAPFGQGMTEKKAKEIARGRAKELLGAMVLDDPNLRNVADGGEVSLDVSSVSLLTPDRWRGAIAGLEGRKSERAMWKLQQATLRELSRSDKQPVELTLPDGRNIRVKLKSLAFNFGINSGAVRFSSWQTPKNTFLKILFYLVGIGFLRSFVETLLGWKKSDNQPGIDSLREKAAEYALGDHSPEDKAKVQALMDQINEIWKSESYKRAGNDPAKLPARVVALSYLLGFKTAFNCKSGKDRTGIIDIEAKFLLTELNQPGGTLPAPDGLLTPGQQKRYMELVRSSGNYEIQACNTGGAPGYKICSGGMRKFYERRIGEKNINDLEGLSGEVSD